MKNNYDSVVFRIDTGPTHVSNQKNTAPPSVQRTWLSFVMLFVALFTFLTSQAQTTLISPSGDGGFELGSTFADNGWTAVNASTDGWAIGTAPVVAAGTKCGYVSANGGTAWTYSQLSTYTHIYKDVTIPAGESILTLNPNSAIFYPFYKKKP